MARRARLLSSRLLLTLAPTLAFAQPARAQAPGAEEGDSAAAARAHYNAGMKAFNDQRYAEAALAFEAAAADKPSPIALFTAALSWDRTNAPDRAADDYARSIAEPGLPPDKAQQARERLASLEPMLGAVAVTGAPGTRVQLDSNAERPVPATLHGAPGVHTLSVLAPGGSIERRPVVIERGKTASFDAASAPPVAQSAPKEAAPPQAAPSPVAPPPPPPASSDLRRTLGVASLGVGGASLLAGVLLGFEALSARDANNASPTQASYDHASSLQTWTNVAFIAGGVFVAGGIALVLWPSPKGAEPAAVLAPAPGGAVLRGVF